MEEIVLKYENGNTSFIGYKLNNLPHSKWQYFYENGNLKEEINFDSGIRHGLYNLFNKSGHLVKSLNYVNNKREGEFIENYEDGKAVRFKGTYLNDRLEGEFQEFYSEGGIKKEGLYKEGLRFGNWLAYPIDESLVNFINYKNGYVNKVSYCKKQGYTLYKEEEYAIIEKIDGHINQFDLIDEDEVDIYPVSVLSKRIYYHDNGIVFKIVPFSNGVAHGKSELFDENGNQFKTETYEDGNLVRS